MSAEQAIAEEAAAFAAEIIAPASRPCDEQNRFASEVHAEARRRGIAHLGFAPEHGGRGISHRGLVAAGLEMAQVCAPIAFTLAFDLGALRPILVAGTAAQRERLVTDLLARGGHASWCMTEPDRSGSNLLALDARAVRVEGGWRIDGHKCMVGMGTEAELFLVLAEAFDGDRRLGPSILAVPRGPAVEVGPNPLKIGFRALPTPDVVFRGVEVGDDALIGAPGEGLAVLLDSLDYMRLGGGTVILGLVRGALLELPPWLESRRVYGGERLGDSSHVQITLGRLLARLRAAERPCREALAALKLVAADLALETTDRAAQLWGWRGVREDYAATKRLRDARQTSVYEGTSEVLAMNLYRGFAAARSEGG